MVAANKVTHVLLAIVLLALIALIAMHATGVRGGPLDPPGPPGSTDSVRLPGTPITGPTTISQPGNYYLTRDIAFNGPGAAITINSSDVTLDLGGFTIRGNDTAGSIGIRLVSTNATVHGGRIKDYNIGVAGVDGFGTLLDNLTVYSSHRGIELGSDSRLLNCSVKGSTETAILVPGAKTQIDGCHLIGGTTGVHFTGLQNHVSNSHFFNIVTGVKTNGENNLVSNNSFTGLSGFALKFESSDNRVLDNVFGCTTGPGIDPGSSGTGNVVSAADHANVCS